MHFARIETRECIHCVIERHQIAGSRSVLTTATSPVEREVLHTSPALYVVATGMIYQDAPHHLGGNGEEMCAILPLHALVVHQTDVGFIYEGSRLERVAGALTLHVVVGQAAKLPIEDRRQALEARS